jgi:hypothetical protein
MVIVFEVEPCLVCIITAVQGVVDQRDKKLTCHPVRVSYVHLRHNHLRLLPASTSLQYPGVQTWAHSGRGNFVNQLSGI